MEVDHNSICNNWINIKYRFDNFPFLLYDAACLRKKTKLMVLSKFIVIMLIWQTYCNKIYTQNVWKRPTYKPFRRQSRQFLLFNDTHSERHLHLTIEVFTKISIWSTSGNIVQEIFSVLQICIIILQSITIN